MNLMSCFSSVSRHALAWCAVVLAATLRAQTIAPPPVSDTPVHPEPTPAHTTAADPGALASIPLELATDLPLWQRGPIALRPHAIFRAMRGTGINVGPGEPVDTDTQMFEPGLRVDLGSHWQADYTATWTQYSNRLLKDSFDESTNAEGGYQYDNWYLSLLGNYSSSHPLLVEAARQTHEIRYSYGFEARRRISDRTQLDFVGDESYRKATPLHPAPDWTPSNTRDWSSRNLIVYQATPRVSGSAGLAFGYTRPSIGPAMAYVRPELALKWTPTERITVNADAGFEQRRVHRSDVKALESPVYTGSIRYRPFPTTALIVAATQGMAVSYLGDTVTKSHAWKVGAQQRLFGSLYASVSMAKQRTRYIATEPILPQLRGDRYETYDARLAAPILSHGTIAVFYERSHNGSSQLGYGFTTRQIGVELRYQF